MKTEEEIKDRINFLEKDNYNIAKHKRSSWEYVEVEKYNKFEIIILKWILDEI